VQRILEILKTQTKQDPTEDWIEKKIFAVRCLSKGFGTYKGYGQFYQLCQLMSFLFLLINIKVMDNYLDVGDFGLHSVGALSTEDAFSIGNIVFPETTKCDWYQYGPGGQLSKFKFSNHIHDTI
jgi:hypothetical protein